MHQEIETIIHEKLTGNDQIAASRFIEYLKSQDFEFYKDENGYWKNRNYFWIKYKDSCVCFISIQNPDEPGNRWTVWSADIDSRYLTDELIDDSLKEVAFQHVDKCVHCGSCSGGKPKTVSGRKFDDVCGCTFRFNNPTVQDLRFMEYMTEAKTKQIDEF